ncbi:MAG: hypothetical protein AAF556_06600, partial [Pseudomonadota bacterium]
MSQIDAAALSNATILIKAGMFEQATEALDVLVADYPEATQPHLLRAMMAQAQSDNQGMATALEAVLKIEPSNQNAAIALAGLIEHISIGEAGLNQLKESLVSLLGIDHRALIGLAAVYLSMGQAAMLPGHIEGIPTEVLSAVDYRGALVAIAQRLDTADQPETALELLLNAVDRLPDANGLEGVIGAMAVRSSQLDTAEHWLDLAIAKDGSDHGVVFARATIMV